MVFSKHFSEFILHLLLWVQVILTSSCIREGLDECFLTTQIYVIVEDTYENTNRIYDVGRAENATIFIFSADSILERVVKLNKQELENRTPVTITYNDQNKPVICVWGNLNGSQDVFAYTLGTNITDFKIQMRNDSGYSIPPDDLFYGHRALTSDNVQEVVIKPWIGRLITTVRGLNDAGNNSENYFFTIESQYDSYGFYGIPQLGNVYMKVDAESIETKQSKLLRHRPINLVTYPASSQQTATIVVKLYRKTSDDEGELIATAETDIKGEDITTHPGVNTNVLIDFGDGNGEISVHIRITEWDYIEQWTIW